MSHDHHRHSHHVIDHAIRAMGRFHGPGGGVGRGRGSGFMGGSHMPGGRKLSSAELQLVLLSLLAEQPAHGYEMIRAVEQRSNGFYVPSPGVIYPALMYLDEIGHAAVAQTGQRKLYSITEEGTRHLAERRAEAEAILDALKRVGSRMEQVREAFAGLDSIDPKAADALHHARHALKDAMLRTRDCTPDKAQRIARILQQATADILAIGT